MNLCTDRMEKIIREYVTLHYEETIALLKEIAVIPAPSGQEEKRAVFVLDWLHRQGAGEAFQDEAGNIVYPYQCDANKKLTVIMAHMDVVHPDRERLPLREENGRLIAPGVRDNTANLVNMLMTIKFLLEDSYHKEYETMGALQQGLLFVADVGEEGLGNLKGSRRIFDDYGKRIDKWLCFDLNYDTLYMRAVGSRRYRITVRTKGGHSYKDFGQKNAIVELSKLLLSVYENVPPCGNVTYNVGQIEGGTSVNTIAQEASMLFEFRSESERTLSDMEEFLQKMVENHRLQDVCIQKETLGIRPGNGSVEESRQHAFVKRCRDTVQKYYGGKVICAAGSTDGNIPLSKGIPSVTVGTVMGEGTHTRQEWVELESLKTGQMIALDLVAGLIKDSKETDEN